MEWIGRWAVLGIAVVLAGSAAAAAAEQPQPKQAGPGQGELITMGSVSQYGITWTFDRPGPVGRFLTGDYYVVGPVTIASISPEPANGRNGSMLNPPVTQSTAIQPQSGPVIGSQNHAPAAVIPTAPTVPVQKNEVAVLSRRAAYRVISP